ncbi:MAG: DUF6438 domain-containing protein [Deltaproteobacteria bacterium]|nr:DUF6438 domain-containing protein [Deltaproteobacteria bacterium]
MVLLERHGCYGCCPEYSVRITSDGSVQFDGLHWVKEFGRRTGQVTPQAFERLVEAVERAGLDRLAAGFHDRLPDSCADGSGISIAVLKDAQLTRVRDRGCRVDTLKEQFDQFIELGEQIDAIAGTGKCIGREAERRATRCLEYAPYGVSLQGTALYRSFTDAAGRLQRHPMLLLDTPVCVERSGKLSPPEADQLLLQLDVDEETFGGEEQLSGRRIEVVGSILHGYSAAHHAPLIFVVDAIDPPREGTIACPTGAALE